MKYYIILFLIAFGIIIYTQREQKICIISEEKQELNIMNTLIDLELSIRNLDYSDAQLSLAVLQNYLIDNNKCTTVFIKIKAEEIKEIIEEMNTSFKPQKKDHLQYLLRGIKAKVLDIELELDENYDLYINYLWAFEEDMSFATNTATDQMLDLYDWNEFASIVDCMNESWELLQSHYSPPSLTFNEELRYKSQTTKKNQLEKSLVAFNRGINSEDYLNYNLCELGEDLQESYYDYIEVFSTSFDTDTYFFTKL